MRVAPSSSIRVYSLSVQIRTLWKRFDRRNHGVNVLNRLKISEIDKRDQEMVPVLLFYFQKSRGKSVKTAIITQWYLDDK